MSGETLHNVRDTNERNPYWIQAIRLITGLLVAIGGLAVFLPLVDMACNNGLICPIQPPAAHFSASPLGGRHPLTVRMNNLSTGSIQRHLWDFGDGTGDDRPNPGQHIYLEPGTYTITLIVEGTRETARYTVTIEVRSDPVLLAGNPTPPVVIVTSTPVPPPSALNPVPPVVPQVSALVSPLAAFNEYFDLVEQDKSTETWPRLTDTWKSRFNPEGYSVYASWVQRVDRVDISSEQVICQTDQWAVIRADLTYYTGNSTPYRQTDRYFALMADDAQGTWLFYDGGENPRSCDQVQIRVVNPTSPPAATAVPALTVPLPTPVVGTTCAGSPPTRLAGLSQARVVYGTGPNNIRAGVESGTIYGQIPEGGVFRILSGPVCGPSSYRQTWYQVSYNGITGWTSEGYGAVYWLEPAG